MRMHRRLLWLIGLMTGLMPGLAAAQTDPPPTLRLVVADKGRVAIVERGPGGDAIVWEVANRHQAHDLHRLPNGNLLLHTSPTKVVEMTPAKEVVWSYEARPKPGYTGRVEVHAFQRLPDGLTMVAESGNRRIVEVDHDGKIVKEIPLVVENPDPHRDTRLARKLANGHYLVCHEKDGKVREYDEAGRVVWTYALDLAGRPATPGHNGHGTEVYGAWRLPSGTTLIATGNGNRVIEVTSDGEIVWSLEQDELPGIRLGWVTMIDVRPDGHLVVVNCHAGPSNPQIIAVTRDKKVLWTYNNRETFGNDMAAALVLEEPRPAP